MLNDKERQEVEQKIAAMQDLLPRAWHSLYEGCISVDFEPQQAMDLVKTYILSQNPHGIRPANDGGAPPKELDRD